MEATMTDGEQGKSAGEHVAGTAHEVGLIARVGAYTVKALNAYAMCRVGLLDELGMRAVIAVAAREVVRAIVDDIRAGRTLADVQAVQAAAQRGDDELAGVINELTTKPPEDGGGLN
jgi:hypothetical protein